MMMHRTLVTSEASATESELLVAFPYGHAHEWKSNE